MRDYVSLCGGVDGMRWFALFMFILFVVVASPASANVGAPLLLLGGLQLVFGNFFIGALEALVLRLTFRLPYRRGLVLMTLANYFSMLVGLALIRLLALPLERATPSLQILQTLPSVITTMWFSFFVATVLLEMPFVYRLFPEEQRSWGKTLCASTLAQGVSYLVLVYLYQGVVNYSLVTQVNLQPDLRFVHPLRAQVYYIGLDGDIWRIYTDGTGKQKVKEADITDRWALLYARAAERGNSWELWCASLDTSSVDAPATHRTKLLNHISSRRVATRKEPYPGLYPKPLDYRPQNQREWSVWVLPWAEEGIRVYHRGSEEYSVAMGTPVLYWRVRAATCLPGDYVVFQLGDYILILHMPTRRLGLLAAGRSPLVVMPDRDAPEEKD